LTIGEEECYLKTIDLQNGKENSMKMNDPRQSSSSNTNYPEKGKNLTRVAKRKIDCIDDDLNLDSDQSKKPENKKIKKSYNKITKENTRKMRMIKATENNHKNYVNVLLEKGLNKEQAELASKESLTPSYQQEKPI